MLKLILNQTTWGIFGSIFGFAIGFLLKIYLINIVGLESWGKYISAQTLITFIDILISISIPMVIIKFISKSKLIDSNGTNLLLNKIFSYSIYASIFTVFSLVFLSGIIDTKIYSNLSDFKFFIIFMSFHIPLTLFSSIITSLFRSVLKIKEIILYGTIINVSVRAIATFIVFMFTKNIFYFIIIELLSSFLSIMILYYIFHKKVFNFNFAITHDFSISNEIVSYGKKIYLNSLLVFFSGKSLAIIVSLFLEPKLIGVYSIFLTITGVSMFLNKNLRKVFSPAVAQIYENKDFSLLNNLYKETTFLINFLTIPISIIIIYLSNNIVYLFDKTEFINEYIFLLHILILTRVISLLFGNTGVYMLMAGLEKNDLYIQIFKTFFTILLSILLIKDYQLNAIVLIFFISNLFVNLMQFIFVYKKLNINPYSKELFLLMLISALIISFYYVFNIEMNLIYVLPFSLIIFLIFSLSFKKKISLIISKYKNELSS